MFTKRGALIKDWRKDMKKKKGILVGSVRKESFNVSVGNYVETIPTETIIFEKVGISKLPLSNQNYDEEGITPE